MKLLEPLKKLPLGYYRLLIVGWLVIPLILAWVMAIDDNNHLAAFVAVFILTSAMYYVVSRLLVWIYEGFVKQDKSK